MTRLPRLYADLAGWWPLMVDPAEYEGDVAVYREALESAASGRIRSVLELGSGGGNIASYLKRHYRLTLADLAPAMLAVSRRLNPECEHAQGDMRTLRLGRSFDAVFVEDAVMYMTSEGDLRAAMVTVHEHLRTGGVALFAPDDTKETFRARTSCGGRDGDGRSFRWLEWSRDPDPADDTYSCVFAYLLQEETGPVRVEHEEHVLGLFPEDTWLRLLGETGFAARKVSGREGGCGLFVGVRE